MDQFKKKWKRKWLDFHDEGICFSIDDENVRNAIDRI